MIVNILCELDKKLYSKQPSLAYLGAIARVATHIRKEKKKHVYIIKNRFATGKKSQEDLEAIILLSEHPQFTSAPVSLPQNKGASISKVATKPISK
jgi:hypothetical protein